MTKEEIQAQIEVWKTVQLSILNGHFKSKIEDIINQIQKQLESAKSIIDLQEEAYNKGFTDMYIQCESTGLKIQKEAFDAGRKHTYSADMNYWEYETFEDYIKSKTGGNM